jgi:hypothetical protein
MRHDWNVVMMSPVGAQRALLVLLCGFDENEGKLDIQPVDGKKTPPSKSCAFSSLYQFDIPLWGALTL